MHRLQISIDQARLARVTEIAHARGSSIAAVIRDAIDIAYADPDAARDAARRALADEVLAKRETAIRW